MGVGTVPEKFSGTEEERAANVASHIFISDEEGDTRCGACDCRPWGAVADWPCGAQVPTVEIVMGER